MPCEFLGVCDGEGENHDELFRNFCAQADALALGDDGGGDGHRRCPGDRPSLSLMLDRVDAFHVGALLALYEHRTAAQGWLYGVNSFDQFGVELGKRLAGAIEHGDAASKSHVRLAAAVGGRLEHALDDKAIRQILSADKLAKMQAALAAMVEVDNQRQFV